MNEPAEILKTTEDCVAVLKQLVGPGRYRRVSKRHINERIVREFINDDREVYLVRTKLNGEFESVEARGAIGQFTLLELIEAARPIKHCGDYFHVYFNQQTGQLWVCMSDGDCCLDNGTSSMEEIKKRLKVLNGVRTIRIEAEHSPDVAADPDWVWVNENQDIGTVVEWI